MSEEKTFDCVFGYGDCPIQALIAKQRQQIMMVTKAIPLDLDLGKDMPKEAREGLSVFMQAIIGAMSRMLQSVGDLATLGNFCAACPKAWEKIGRTLSDISAETQSVTPVEETTEEK